MSKKKQAEILAFANQKGGVGKTMSTFNIGMGLAYEGKKILLIDIDPQANLTMCAGFDPDELDYTLSGLLDYYIKHNKYPEDISEYLLKISENEKVTMIAADMNLAGMQLGMQSIQFDKEYILKTLIEKCAQEYDYILIDCPPSMDALSVNALVAADQVIIPTQPQIFSFKGSVQLWQHIQNIKKRLNPDLKIGGILITMLNKVSRNNKEIIEAIQEVYGPHVFIFSQYIPLSVKAGESNQVGLSIFAYDKNGQIAQAYQVCVKEILANE